MSRGKVVGIINTNSPPSKKLSLQLDLYHVHEVNSPIDLFIGMYIIKVGDFALTCHDGKTVMSFNIPHRQFVDFLQAP